MIFAVTAVLLVILGWLVVSHVAHRRVHDQLRAEIEAATAEFHRQMNGERSRRDTLAQELRLNIASLQADLKAAQFVQGEFGRQILAMQAENEGIIRFLMEVPQNFNLHLPAETFAILLPDRLKMDLQSES